MKKKTICMILVFALMVTVMGTAAYADGGITPLDEYDPVQGVDYVYFQGSSGEWYYVNFASDYVGDAYSAYSAVNGVCQAFVNGSIITHDGNSTDTITVDRWWGSKTRTALVKAQGYCGLTADGICGPNTWRGMYSYTGCVIGIELGKGIIPLIKNYL